MSKRHHEIRVPSSLIQSHLPAWVKLVWIVIRGFQGRGEYCFASFKTIGEEIKNERGNSMDKGQVSRAVSMLKNEGLLVSIGSRKIACSLPENVDQESTIEEAEALIRSQRSLIRSQRKVDQESTVVDQESTPSENQQLKPTFKTNKENNIRVLPGGLKSYDEAMHSWNEFASLNALSKIREITNARRQKIKTHAAKIWPVIDEVYSAIQSNPFYLGAGSRGWKVTFDHIWKNDDNHIKILENGTTQTDRRTAGGQPGRDVHHAETGSSRKVQAGVQASSNGNPFNAQRKKARPGEQSKMDYLLSAGYGTDEILSTGEDDNDWRGLPSRQEDNP